MQNKFTDKQIHRIYSGWFKKLQLNSNNHNEKLLILIRASGRYLGIYEVWKDIPKYEGLYQVSNFGRVKSLKRIVLNNLIIDKTIKERILKHGVNRHGYNFVILSNCGKHKLMTIHKLVAMCFLNHLINSRIIVVDHKDNIRKNNNISNLQIVTNRLNCSKDRKNKTSQYTGVSWAKLNKKWIATIKINNNQIYLGLFDNEYDAHLEYQRKLNNIT